MKRLCHKLLLLFDDRFNWIPTILFSISGLLLVVYMLYSWFPAEAVTIYKEEFHNTSNNDTQNTGQIGDTIGGTLGPFVGLIAAALTGLAFWVQYRANQNQRRDLKIERFENKFYALIEIHRQNINELRISNVVQGRKAFVSMFNELKLCYYLVEHYYEKVYLRHHLDPISEEARFNVSYLIFFFGVGPNSSLVIEDLVGEKYLGFFLCVERYMLFHQTNWENFEKRITVETGDSFYSYKPKYKPFDGHVSKLSHYLRNLFQLTKYVDKADDKIFEYDDKYNYATTIRSQLSVHEQLLIFYNSISILGKPWLDEPNLLKEYCLIKSSALTLANFYKNPKDILGGTNRHGKQMFEWDEIKSRIQSI